jgi:glutaredoxin
VKTTSIIIAALAIALLFSTYLLADSIYKRIGKSEVSLFDSIAGQTDKKETGTPAALPPTRAELDIREALQNTARQSAAPAPRTETRQAETPRQNMGPIQRVPEKKEVKTVRDVRDVRVVMYMTDWCPHCRRARDFIISQGVSLIEYNIERDRSAAEEMVRKTGGSRGVPVIDVEGIILRGFSSQQIENAIKQKQNG